MDKQQTLLSIVIPEYNGYQTITKCLDSIYDQGIDNNLFEVVCVDDGSSDKKSITYIENLISCKHYVNFTFIRNLENRRQGAARNTGVDHASGKWIIYLDCDDYLLPGSLSKLLSFLILKDNLDMVVYDYSMPDRNSCNINFAKEEMTGRKFLQTQPVPWIPCCNAYKKEFLIKNKIKFVENVVFEDTDYVMKCVLFASRIQFISIPVFFYVQYEEQTSKISNNFKKAEDAFKLTLRLKNLASEIRKSDIKSSNAILNHHYFLYLNNLYFVWTFSFSQIYYLFKQYPASHKGSNIPFIVKVSTQCPLFFSALLFIMRPLFSMFIKIKEMLKDMKRSYKK